MTLVIAAMARSSKRLKSGSGSKLINRMALVMTNSFFLSSKPRHVNSTSSTYFLGKKIWVPQRWWDYVRLTKYSVDTRIGLQTPSTSGSNKPLLQALYGSEQSRVVLLYCLEQTRLVLHKLEQVLLDNPKHVIRLWRRCYCFRHPEIHLIGHRGRQSL